MVAPVDLVVPVVAGRMAQPPLGGKTVQTVLPVVRAVRVVVAAWVV
jgi:hypothetical protein